MCMSTIHHLCIQGQKIVDLSKILITNQQICFVLKKQFIIINITKSDYFRCNFDNY